MRAAYLLTFVFVAAGLSTAVAQQPGPTGRAVVASEPGKASAAATVEVRATVVAIDKATRTVALKGARRTLDVVVGDEVQNFDQIRVGDEVVAQYREAISLELRKTRAPVGITGAAGAARAAPGASPAAGAAREITVLADVVGVDPGKSTISLKGPLGNIVVLKVENPDHFKVVRKGDQVEAIYSEAVAIKLEPAKPAGKK